jgi:FAD/FMN-containing dehydrogenase
VGAGATWAQAVTATAAAHGLAPLCASSTAVGVAGYTLGGGMGPLGRRHGFAAAVQQAVDPDGMFARTPLP